jgi:cell division protein FtsX
MTRSQQRSTFPTDMRVALLEADVDEIERGIDRLREELKGIRNVLTGILISVMTGSVLVAINIVFGSMHH